MYRIGEFSKIVDIPVRTLRYYDEYGILQPSEIDIFTGYRYYNEENILECEFIKLLKSLDFTLEEILLHKDCIDEEVVLKKKKEIEQRMYLLKMKYERLTLMEKEIEDGKYIKKKEDINRRVLRRNYEKGNSRKSD